MTYKKAPVHLTWDANDYKRVTAYFALLVQIDKRVSKTNSSSHTTQEEPKKIEQPKLKPDIWTRDPTGPFFTFMRFKLEFRLQVENHLLDIMQLNFVEFFRKNIYYQI